MVREYVRILSLVAILTIQISPSLHSQEKDCIITIQASMVSITPYEPLNIEIQYNASSDSLPNLEAFVNKDYVGLINKFGEHLSGVYFPKKLPLVQEGTRYKSTIYTVIFAHPLKAVGLNPIEWKYLFDKPGKYEISIIEKNSNTKSNALTITVRETNSQDKESAKLFISGKHTALDILQIGAYNAAWKPNADTLANFEKIVKDYPDTPFAIYASHILGVQAYYQKQPEDPNAKNLQEFHAMRDEYRKKIVNLLQPAIVATERSLLQEEALFVAMKCCGRVQNHEETEKFFRMLLEKYPYGVHAATARSMAKGEKSLEAIIEEVENARERDSK